MKKENNDYFYIIYNYRINSIPLASCVFCINKHVKYLFSRHKYFVSSLFLIIVLVSIFSCTCYLLLSSVLTQDEEKITFEKKMTYK